MDPDEIYQAWLLFLACLFTEESHYISFLYPSYRFVIGREKPGQVSEVAQLISQTLEQERRQRELLEQHYAQYDADDDEVSSHGKRTVFYLFPRSISTL